MNVCLAAGSALFFQNMGALRSSGFLSRMGLLATGGAGVLYVRWAMMGTGPPAFTEVDNPASFADSMLVRVSSEPSPLCTCLTLTLTGPCTPVPRVSWLSSPS